MIEICWRFRANWSTQHIPRNKNLNEDKHLINLDVVEMLQAAKESNVPVEEVFSTFISHEVLHAVLFEYVGRKAWNDLDNICSRRLVKQINGVTTDLFFSSMKQWFGGIIVNP